MHKVSKGIAAKVFAGISSSKLFRALSSSNYDLRYHSELSRSLVHLVFNDTETASFLGTSI